MDSGSSIQVAPPSGADELDQLRFMIAQFAEAYPRTLKPRDPREFALKIKDQKKQSNKENAAPAPRLKCYMMAGGDYGEPLLGYAALSEPRFKGKPPTLKQLFVRKPERRKGLATAALRCLPFRYADNKLLVEQPVKATHFALESAGWRLVRVHEDGWLYYRGIIAESLPKVDFISEWEWIESEAYGSSKWASALPVSLAFYPTILSRASLERATGDDGVSALLAMCTGQASSTPLYDLYDASAKLENIHVPAGTQRDAQVPGDALDEVCKSIPEASSVSTPLEPSTPPSAVARKGRLLNTLDQEAYMTPLLDQRHHLSQKRKRELNTGLSDSRGALQKVSHTEFSSEQRHLLQKSNQPADPGLNIRESEEPLHDASSDAPVLSEHATPTKPQHVDMDMRVVQSDFINATLSLERCGLKVDSISAPTVTGIRVNDLIIKVNGVALHSKVRQRPPLRDGMAIKVRRQLC